MRRSPEIPQRAVLLDREKRATSAPGREREPYSPPQLIVWGSVRELTRGGSGGALDFGPTVTKAF
jgi:hypothetical protein